jgi:hypothetical protein
MITACLRAFPARRRHPIEAKISHWVMDTGSAIDLVSAPDIAPMKHLVVSSENPPSYRQQMVLIPLIMRSD